jgi:hypothetical protein
VEGVFAKYIMAYARFKSMAFKVLDSFSLTECDCISWLLEFQ